MARARIGVVGYFGHGNYGDELFLDVYRKFFYDCEVVVLQGKDIKVDDSVIDSVDCIIIGGGDLFIPKHFASNYFDSRFLRKPVFFHGIGVPLWTGEDPSVIARMAEYVRHKNVRTINARDAESVAWLKAKLAPTGPVDHSADMVFSLDFPRVARPSTKKVFGLIMRKLTPGTVRWDRITQMCDRARGFGYDVHNIVLGTGEIRADDLIGLQEFDYGAATLVDPNDIYELTKAIGACDVVASTKFHGCVVAAAYGIPAITLATTDKFVNLYRLMERTDLLGHYRHEDVVERLPKFMPRIPQATVAMLREEATTAMTKLRHRVLNEID